MRHTLTLVNVIKSQKYSVYVLNNNTNITGTVIIMCIYILCVASVEINQLDFSHGPGTGFVHSFIA